ncbi:MAG: hypothetical protein JW778_07620 [Candidatus Altiarchaeota archaeon]|nr:hypothetical protein [Candidatus Altiarchaeota archaeon]
MAAKRFSNQSGEQIIKHISNFLQEDCSYDLFIDPLGIRFLITESTRKRKKPSVKRMLLRKEHQNMSKGLRKLSGTRKRTKPKIRSIKKGRTVSLKGRTY